MNRRRSYAAIALVSCAILIFEIAATRLLSVVHWYHWAFMCVSLAMLGIGAPGVWFTFARQPDRFLPLLLLLSGALVPLSVGAIVTFGHHMKTMGVVFSMSCLLLPMLCLGGAVCLLLMRAEGAAVSRMYGFDLAGACAGALLVIPLMHALPTPWLMGALGFLPLSAHVVLRGRPSKAALTVAVGVVALLVWREPFHLHYSKAYAEEGARKPIYEKWTPTARLTFFDNVFWVRDKNAGFNWGQGTRARPQGVGQYWMEQDGSAGTAITHFTGDLATVEFLLDDVTTAGYQVRPPETVAIIGGGGGRDILSARVVGATSIDAIELNGQIIKILSTRFKEFAGDVYHQPGVTAIAGEGRSALTRTDKQYDMIQISLIDSWAATAAGAFALSENNLYTVEAFRLYYRHLTPHGMLSTSRWMAGFSATETPRLFMMAQEALREEGVADPNPHLAVVQGGAIGTVLMSRSPFTHEEYDSLSSVAERRGFTVHFPPTNRTPSDSPVVVAATRGVDAFRAEGLRLDPPTDDRPFFFQVVSPFRPVDRVLARKLGMNTIAIHTLQVLMVVMAALTLVFFLLPFVLRRPMGAAARAWRGSLFFGAIGVGFMLVEIPMVQRFVLYLGHPSYATTVVLASVLLGASVGSMASARVGLARVERYGLVLPVLVLVLNLLLSPLFTATLGWPFAARAVLTVAMLLPLAFGMGLFFPLGMVRFGDEGKPWFWAVNGATGVLASVVSVALSMELGFRGVVWIAALFYVAAWALLWTRRAPGPAASGGGPGV